jgi:hypothetical protein
MSVDVSKMTATEIAALLAQVRKAEKEKKAEIDALPLFAFLLVMDDSSLVFWSGKAVDTDSAIEAAKVYATKDGKTVFGVAPRPLPGPRGKKAKVAS